MTLEASGILEPAVKAQYLRTLVQEGELCQFDLICADVESANPLTAEAIILGLGSYFPPINLILMQKRAMRRGMRKLQKTLSGSFD